MDYISKDIGIRISQLRNKFGITQEKLAEKLNITVKHMSAVERGVSSLSLEKLIDTSKLFDCTLDYLILGTDNNSTALLPPSILSILSSNDEHEKKILLEYLNLYSKIRKQ